MFFLPVRMLSVATRQVIRVPAGHVSILECASLLLRLGPRTTVESLGDGRSKCEGSRLLLPLADKCRFMGVRTGSQWRLFSCMYTSVYICDLLCDVCVCVGVECVSVCVCVSWCPICINLLRSGVT